MGSLTIYEILFCIFWLIILKCYFFPNNDSRVRSLIQAWLDLFFEKLHPRKSKIIYDYRGCCKLCGKPADVRYPDPPATYL